MNKEKELQPIDPGDIESNMILLLHKKASPDEFSSYFLRKSIQLDPFSKVMQIKNFKDDALYSFATGQNPQIPIQQDNILCITRPTSDLFDHHDINIHLGKTLQRSNKYSAAFQTTFLSPTISLHAVTNVHQSLGEFFDQHPYVLSDFWTIANIEPVNNVESTNTQRLASSLMQLFHLPGFDTYSVFHNQKDANNPLFFKQWRIASQYKNKIDRNNPERYRGTTEVLKVQPNDITAIDNSGPTKHDL